MAPTQQGAGPRINLGQLYRQSPLGLVAAFLCGLTTSVFFALGPILRNAGDLIRLELRYSWHAAPSEDFC